MKTESRQKPDSSRRSASPQPEKPKELYLKIPYHILNIPEIGLPEKVLLAHFYSFGKKGCWQSNATLAKMFMTTRRTIGRWIGNIQKTGKIRQNVRKVTTGLSGSARIRMLLQRSKSTAIPDKTGPLHLDRNVQPPRTIMV